MGDFYQNAAAKRYQVLQAAKQRTIANLAEHQANNDEFSAQEEIQQLAVLNDQMASLERLDRDYYRQMNPPAPPPPTDRERAERSPDRMTVEDVENIFRNSKHAKDFSFSDPDVQRRIREGQAELTSRKRTPGYYKG